MIPNPECGFELIIYGFFRSLKMRIWGYALPTPKSCFLHNVVIFTLQPVLVWILVPEVNDNGCSQKGWFLHRGVSLNMVGVTMEPKLFLWWRMMAYTNKHYIGLTAYILIYTASQGLYRWEPPNPVPEKSPDPMTENFSPSCPSFFEEPDQVGAVWQLRVAMVVGQCWC